MSNTQHTPGPWAMPDSGQGRISKVGANGGWGGMIATADCGDYARSRAEGLANARLIAAAPDLLELLREAADYTRHPDYDWPVEFSRRVSAAIAKATGGAV